MNIITTNPEEIARKYPTLIDFYVKITRDPVIYRGPPVQRHDLYIVYVLNATIMIDSYFRPRGYDDHYKPNGTKTLTETVMELDRFDPLYNFFKGMGVNKRYWFAYRKQFKKWLEKARSRIVIRESSQDKIDELLEMGLNMSDVIIIINSRLKGKLSQ